MTSFKNENQSKVNIRGSYHFQSPCCFAKIPARAKQLGLSLLTGIPLRLSHSLTMTSYWKWKPIKSQNTSSAPPSKSMFFCNSTENVWFFLPEWHFGLQIRSYVDVFGFSRHPDLGSQLRHRYVIGLVFHFMYQPREIEKFVLNLWMLPR